MAMASSAIAARGASCARCIGVPCCAHAMSTGHVCACATHRHCLRHDRSTQPEATNLLLWDGVLCSSLYFKGKEVQRAWVILHSGATIAYPCQDLARALDLPDASAFSAYSFQIMAPQHMHSPCAVIVHAQAMRVLIHSMRATWFKLSLSLHGASTDRPLATSLLMPHILPIKRRPDAVTDPATALLPMTPHDSKEQLNTQRQPSERRPNDVPPAALWSAALLCERQCTRGVPCQSCWSSEPGLTPESLKHADQCALRRSAYAGDTRDRSLAHKHLIFALVGCAPVVLPSPLDDVDAGAAVVPTPATAVEVPVTTASVFLHADVVSSVAAEISARPLSRSRSRNLPTRGKKRRSSASASTLSVMTTTATELTPMSTAATPTTSGTGHAQKRARTTAHQRKDRRGAQAGSRSSITPSKNRPSCSLGSISSNAAVVGDPSLWAYPPDDSRGILAQESICQPSDFAVWNTGGLFYAC